MKKSNYRFITTISLTCLLIIAACGKSYLEKEPLGTLNETNLANKAGVEGLLIGAYSLLDGRCAQRLRIRRHF